MMPPEMSPSQPLARSFTPRKQGAQRHYGSHPYFTKRAWNVVQEYIKYFSSPGDVVLDPFGGSGVTAVESLVLRRKARYVDVSAWACFLARQTAIAPVALSPLAAAFQEIERLAKPMIEDIWATPNEALQGRAVADWYPKAVPLPANADVSLVEELFTPRMLHGLARLRSAIMATEHQPSRELLLMAFSATLARINKTFLSTANRAESRGGSAIFSIYRYKVAKEPVELPLWGQFCRRYDALVACKRETNELIGEYYSEDETAFFDHASATRLLDSTPAESVDYIYTDPPYGANISYLDLSTMWCAWLDLPVTAANRAEEVIEGGQLRKSRDVYHHLLTKSLNQMYEVLKPRGWMSLVFAHRDVTYWDALVDACVSAGFDYRNTVVQPVGVVWSMHKKKNPLRVLSGELVLNFRKIKVRRSRRSHNDPAPLNTVRSVAERVIVERIGATTEELHHAVIPALLETGGLAAFGRDHGDLTPVLEECFQFDKPSGKWHISKAPIVAVLPAMNRLRYYAARKLAECDEFTCGVADVRTAVEAAMNGEGFSDDELREALESVAFSPDDTNWRLRKVSGQREFLFEGGDSRVPADDIGSTAGTRSV